MTGGPPAQEAASEFDTDTAIERVGDGRYRGTVTDRWDVLAAPNGGYLMGIGLRALADALPQPDPLTVTGHFLTAARPGPVEVAVETLRTGRTVATGVARMLQDGREFLHLTAMFGELPSADAAETVANAPPDLPPPDDLPRGKAVSPDGRPVPIGERFDLRFPPGVPGWLRGEPTGEAATAGWFRFADGRDVDPIAVPQVVDGFFPVVFELGVIGWVPTLELTVHIRRRPSPGWLRCRVTTRHVVGGYLEEDAEVWDADGRFIAQSRQLARAPR
jgi:acyl-CoA thioesterase